MNVNGLSLTDLLAMASEPSLYSPPTNSYTSCGCDMCIVADELAANKSSDPDVTRHFDLAMLDRVTERLGITLPIYFGKLVDDYPVHEHSDIAMFGASKVREGAHIVLLHPWMLEHLHTEANQTLCHELTHCMQSEQEGVKENDTNYQRATREVGYWDNPYEVEARHYGETLAAEFQVVVR